MNAEFFYNNSNFPKLDKFDKKSPQFTYHELIEFADNYYKYTQQQKSTVVCKYLDCNSPNVVNGHCMDCDSDQNLD